MAKLVGVSATRERLMPSGCVRLTLPCLVSERLSSALIEVDKEVIEAQSAVDGPDLQRKRRHSGQTRGGLVLEVVR
eukprot:5538-Eustigmatos_ZCMA.PRE.1